MINNLSMINHYPVGGKELTEVLQGLLNMSDDDIRKLRESGAI